MNLFFTKNKNTKFNSSIGPMDYFFLLESNLWNFVDNLENADVVPICYLNFETSPNLADELSQDQLALVWIIETHGGHVTPEYYRNSAKQSLFLKKHKKTLFVHTNQLDKKDPQYIPHDIMFNRHKLFCTDYREEYNNGTKQWIHTAPKSTYSLSSIVKQFSYNNKIFLCPNRVSSNQGSLNKLESFQAIKLRLQEFMKSLNCPMYLSDPTNGVYFKPNGWSEEHLTFSAWDFQLHQMPQLNGKWHPIGDQYYQTSYISVCIETLCLAYSDDIFYASEKSFDPLIKGNFPLIFSSPYHIKRLKDEYGFKFPDWIDYSYDSIHNIQDRFKAFLNSINSLSKIPVEKLHEMYVKDKHILEHNKNIFFTKPYDSLYNKMAKSINTLGW